MSIAAFSISEAPVAGDPLVTDRPVRRPPPKRQFVAKADIPIAPEPR